MRWVYDDKCSTYESEEENGVEPCKRISSSKSDEKKKNQLKLTLTLNQLKFFNFFLSITSLIDDSGSLPSTCSSREVEKDVDIHGIAFKLLEAFE